MNNFTVQQIPLAQLKEAPWNPNVVPEATLEKVRHSIKTFGIVENLVARPLGDDFEVISGNHRLKLYRKLGINPVPCHIVQLDDAHAMLLAEALNHTRGKNNPDAYQAMLQQVAQMIEPAEMLKLINESEKSLNELLGAMPEAGDAPVETVPAFYGVVVTCETEAQQLELIERLSVEGYETRALLA